MRIKDGGNFCKRKVRNLEQDLRLRISYQNKILRVLSFDYERNQYETCI